MRTILLVAFCLYSQYAQAQSIPELWKKRQTEKTEVIILEHLFFKRIYMRNTRGFIIMIPQGNGYVLADKVFTGTPKIYFDAKSGEQYTRTYRDSGGLQEEIHLDQNGEIQGSEGCNKNGINNLSCSPTIEIK